MSSYDNCQLVTVIFAIESITTVSFYQAVAVIFTNRQYNDCQQEIQINLQLTTFLESSNALFESQSAYRRFHSTESILLKVFSDLNPLDVKLFFAKLL